MQNGGGGGATIINDNVSIATKSNTAINDHEIFRSEIMLF